MTRTCIDLSHVVEEGMTTYPGLPGPAFEDFLTREESRARLHPDTAFHIGTIRMVGNTGTYLDSPFHRFQDGADLADLPLSSLANLHGLVVRPDPARLPEGVAIWIDVGMGSINAVERIASEYDKSARFVMKATYRDWEQIARGRLDLSVAIAMGKVKVVGGRAKLLQHVDAARILGELLSEIPTRFD